MTSDAKPVVASEATDNGQSTRSRTPRRGQTKVLELPETLSVQRLSELTDQNPIDVIKQLMRNGIMASMNQIIDYQMATLVTTAFGIHTTLAETEPEISNAAPEATEQRDELSLIHI